MDWQQLTIPAEATIREALARIDETGRQFAIVLRDGRLVGLLTDGDVRRGLLRGLALDAPIGEVLNMTPVVLGPEATQADLDRIRSAHGVRNVPVVDGDGRLLGVIGPDESVSTPLSTPVVLMAGGRGQRLHPITKSVPKPMVEVGGMPMIEVILRRLHAQGFRRVHVSVNYLAEQIIEHLDDGAWLGLEISYLHERTPLGTAGALAQLDGRLAEPFIVMNSDLLTDVDLRRMRSEHLASGSVATIGVREFGFEIPFGVVRMSSGVVEGLIEKPRHEELVSAGIYVLEPEVLARLAPDTYCDMPTLLVELVDAGRRVGAFRIDGDWIDVGRPEDLDRARAAVEQHR